MRLQGRKVFDGAQHVPIGLTEIVVNTSGKGSVKILDSKVKKRVLPANSHLQF
jgi:hypothetical protein